MTGVFFVYLTFLFNWGKGKKSGISNQIGGQAGRDHQDGDMLPCFTARGQSLDFPLLPQGLDAQASFGALAGPSPSWGFPWFWGY